MARQSLPKGPGRPWREAVEVQRGLCWRPQDAEEAGTMRYLPKRAANGEWNQLKRKRDVSGIKTGRAETWKPFDTVHGASEFAICPAGVWFCFVPIFPH